MRWSRRTIAIACFGMVSFGIVLTTLGASLPAFMARFGIEKAQAGSLLSLIGFGVLAGSLVFGPIVDRRGYKNLLIFAFATIIIGLEITAFAPSLAVLRGSVLLIGFSGGLVNGAVNALTSDVGAEQRASALTFVGAFFGVGAAGVPLVLALMSDSASPATILAAIAPAIAIPLALTAISVFPASKQPQGLPMADVRRLLRDRVLLLMGAVLFLESGVETTMGGWITTFFAEELGVGAERASLDLALFWFGLLLARLILGVVLRRIGSVHVVLASIVVSIASVLVLISTESLMTGASAVFFLGCGLAATFPVIFGFVGDRYAQLSGTALSLVMVMALSGGMLMPYVVGVLGEARGMRVSLILVPVCLLIQAGLFAFLAHRRR